MIDGLSAVLIHQSRKNRPSPHHRKGYEEKLHLVNKFLSAKEKITEIQKTAELIKEKNKDAGLDTLIDEILTKSEEIFEEL